MRNIFFYFIILFLLLSPVFPVSSQEPENLSARGEYLTIKIALIGPGDEIYFWWGHIGLIIEDALSGETLLYDWGVFSFDTDNFYLDFAFGRPFYACAASRADYSISHYKNTNRDLILYTLDLSPEAKMEVLRFAENNIKPENRNYRYHHFRDNCATRVRDIIDFALGGAFKDKYGSAPGRFTLREHVHRHTWFSPFWHFALSFWMGQGIDQPLTVWEEMFLPSEITRNALDFSYTDNTGQLRSLVSNTEIISRSIDRPLPLSVPGQSIAGELILGLSAAVLLGFLSCRTGTIRLPIAAKKNNSSECVPSRSILGTAQACLGLFFGIMGFLLFFLVFFTDHDYTFYNFNLVFINPLLFAAVPLGLIFAFSKNQKKRQKSELFLKVLWSYVFFAGFLTIVFRLFSVIVHQNQSAQALVLPIAFVLGILPWIYKKRKEKKEEF